MMRELAIITAIIGAIFVVIEVSILHDPPTTVAFWLVFSLITFFARQDDA